jgi:hypothetical protein
MLAKFVAKRVAGDAFALPIAGTRRETTLAL